MIKINEQKLDDIEGNYPGFYKELEYYENQPYPDCPLCHSSDTAICRAGLIGRSMSLAASTTRIKLHPNGPFKGVFFCNACSQYFDNPVFQHPSQKK